MMIFWQLGRQKLALLFKLEILKGKLVAADGKSAPSKILRYTVFSRMLP